MENIYSSDSKCSDKTLNIRAETKVWFLKNKTFVLYQNLFFLCMNERLNENTEDYNEKTHANGKIGRDKKPKNLQTQKPARHHTVLLLYAVSILSKYRNFIFVLAANPSLFSPFSTHWHLRMRISHRKQQGQWLKKRYKPTEISKTSSLR